MACCTGPSGAGVTAGPTVETHSRTPARTELGPAAGVGQAACIGEEGRH